MNTIVKFTFPTSGTIVTVQLPYARELALVDMENENYLSLWLVVDTDPHTDTELVSFKVVQTGAELEDEWLHVGSVVDAVEGAFHLFEKETDENERVTDE